VKPILLDTSTIVASLDRSERFHKACVDSIAEIAGPLVTCEAVIAECCYLLRNLQGAPDAVLQNVEARVFQIPLSLQDMAGPVRRILRKYDDSDIELADACLIHLAGELNTGEILTLDSDFEHYRWGRKSRFKLLVNRHA